jgi:hypothetical protein
MAASVDRVPQWPKGGTPEHVELLGDRPAEGVDLSVIPHGLQVRTVHHHAYADI